MAALDTVLKNIFTIAGTIYRLNEQAKTNKKLCQCLKQRIVLLMKPLKKLENDPEKTRDMEDTLVAFQNNLKSAKEWMEDYSTIGWWRQFLKAYGSYRRLQHINNQLSDTAEVLQILLKVEEREMFLRIFNEPIWKDIKEDIHNLEHLIKSEVRSVGDQVDYGVQQIIAILTDQNGQQWNIREIPASELEYGALQNTTNRYKTYKGMYKKNYVLIKVMLGEPETDNEVVKNTFLKEGQTMKKYESPNILQVFGICIENMSEGPRYSLVTEFCEKGTLRDMLQREKDLKWEQKLMMALDASSALYGIHHKERKAIYHSGRNMVPPSENKSILHGSLSSRKYLVKGYSLKLSGFEFSKTESSMFRNPDKKPKEVELAYHAPEVLTSAEYDQRSEIFSLGVVIYEIVTGSLPLQGLSLSDFHGNPELVYQKLCAEVTAGLQISCPSILCGIIRDCLQSDPQKRPNAGDIADRLVARPESQVPMIETVV